MTLDEYLDAISRTWPKTGEAASDEVIQLCSEAVAKYPDDPVLWYNLGVLFERAPDSGPYTCNDYRRCFEAALRLDPGCAEAYQELGFVLDVYADEFETAAALFRKAIALGAGQESYYGLARVLAEQGRREEALAILDPKGCPWHDHPDIGVLRSEIVEGQWEPRT